MALTICNVTGTVTDSEGNVLANKAISFLRTGTVASQGSTPDKVAEVPLAFTVQTNVLGAVDFDAYPANYRGTVVRANAPDLTFDMAVPDAASAEIADIIDSVSSMTPTLLQESTKARDDAQVAAATAQGVADNFAGGAYGLGVTTTSPTLADIDATNLAAGFFRTDITSAGTFPTASLYGYLAVHRWGHLDLTQIWQRVYSVETYYRIYRSELGGWQPWRMNYTQESILGAVSQSGGVPTGRLIERGSNVNGEYVRFADGTQICEINESNTITTAAYGSIHRVSVGTWTFPAAFLAGTVPSVTFLPHGLALWGGAGAPSNTASGSRMINSAVSLTSAAATYNTVAIGRWI